ncbi:3-carboxy-cis,cis-muconate cycloisomerase [Gandjariella thermophila]|uniref:3-carboxy-cis,cis-muconate cycloisomerase n=1 Tax=Gandjariella thermophila TaxID=1931992 RepID=A0A4D4JAS2_9PSEU|nr:3-carboxy-cis,cis-muconate cycloisomerase [Gandjariella thermophila]GDY31536.1 3-carboxy-cis,cis-muconate cycloisomerase [Gandjariella thermophila]
MGSTRFGGLLGPVSGDAEVDAALDDRALLAALLRFEAALARAQARVGVLPADAAEAIVAACVPDHYDADDLGRRAAGTGAPVAPLTRDIGARVPEDARRWVHFGATTQDVMDTALMLLAHRATGLVGRRLAAAADACAELARRHRDTPMVARTVGQHALPTTFGLKAAGWLAALDVARARLAAARARLAVQFGGAAGTLAALGEQGTAVLAALAEELGLAAPSLPWHTDRTRVHELAGALGSTVAALGKIATDVVLGSQQEVGELAEPTGGGSSAMPHKRNPIASVRVIAAARRTPGLVATLLAAGLPENERATGSWHAEWEPLRDLLHLTGGAAGRTAEVLAGLRVHPDRMRANLDLTGGAILAERVTGRLADTLGRAAAHDLVAELARTAAERGVPLREVLLADDRVNLAKADVDAALDPTTYLGSTGAFVDRALDEHRRGGGDE